MSENSDKNANDTMRDHFLGWQCRLREHSIRKLNGEPSPGMTPDIAVGDSGTGFGGVRVLLVLHDPERHTPEIKHMVRKTRDPKQRYENALKYFSESYYQDRKKFTGSLTALFTPGSDAARRLIEAGTATLVFDEKSQRYVIPASVETLQDSDPDWQATYWHNHLYNPKLAGDSIVLRLTPDWANAKADPPVY